MIEHHHREKVRDGERGNQDGRGVALDEQELFAGQGRHGGHCMVAPDLLGRIAKELARGASILKEARKAREERQLARPKK